MSSSYPKGPGHNEFVEPDISWYALAYILYGRPLPPSNGGEPDSLLRELFSHIFDYPMVTQDAIDDMSYQSYQLPNPSVASTVTSWLHSRKSQTLAIIDTAEDRQDNALSRLSQLCVIDGQLANPGSVPRIISLSFFCGLHTSPDNLFHGPAGMLRCLLFQLLAQYTELLDVINLKHFITLEQWRGIQRYRIVDLLWLFKVLVAQPHRASRIICMIDGITKFEITERPCAMDHVIEYLQKEVRGLNEDGYRSTFFKLLVTTPKLGQYSDNKLSQKFHLRVPSQNPLLEKSPSELVDPVQEIKRAIRDRLWSLDPNGYDGSWPPERRGVSWTQP